MRISRNLHDGLISSLYSDVVDELVCSPLQGGSSNPVPTENCLSLPAASSRSDSSSRMYLSASCSLASRVTFLCSAIVRVSVICFWRSAILEWSVALVSLFSVSSFWFSRRSFVIYLQHNITHVRYNNSFPKLTLIVAHSAIRSELSSYVPLQIPLERV